MASIDIVIPNRNYGYYLHDCIQSVLTQDVDALRVLVIDNASTDDSVEIAQEAARLDPRVEVVAHKKNRGQHASYNQGIDWARSDYFLILCSDDLLVEGCLRRAAQAMDEHADVHLTYGSSFYVEVGQGGMPGILPEAPDGWRFLRGSELIRSLCRTGRSHISDPTALVRTAVQKKVGYYRPELPHTDDLEVWLRFGCHGGAAETRVYQAIKRVHGNNQSSALRDTHSWNMEIEAAFETFFRNEGAMLPEAARLRRVAINGLGERAFCSGLSTLFRGEPGAMELLAFSVRTRRARGVLPPMGYIWRRLVSERGRNESRAGTFAAVP